MPKKNKKKTITNKEKTHLKKEPNINELNNKQSTLKTILIWYLVSRLFLIVFLIIKGDLSVLELYDGQHYIEMAKAGYSSPFLYAFFPLYPILIKILHIIIPSYQISGALISNICSILSILLLNKMTNNKENKLNLICFIFSPILAYTSIVYTESLFMLLTILGYYLYKKDKYILSSIIIGLTILTRNSGIILWGAIGLDMLHRLFIQKDKTIKFKNIITFGIIALVIGMIYPTYLYIKTGNFLEFAAVQDKYWGREKGVFIDGIIKDIKVILRTKEAMIINIIIFLQNWISFFLTFILGIKIFKKDKVASIYTIVSLIAFQTMYRDIDMWVSLSSISLFRYVLNLFPIYLYLFDNKKETNKLLIFSIFLLISIFNTLLIYSGAFLA